jgi:type IV pilus secretin PilQ/predicted competence protein
MTKIHIRLTTFVVGLALALAGFSQTGSAPVPVRLTILPTRVNARVVLEGLALPADVSPVYAAGNDAVLVISLTKAAVPSVTPLIPADEPALIKAANFIQTAGGRPALALTLAERVPFRYWTEGTKTVIELIKIQRGDGDYLIAPETKTELDRTTRAAQPISFVGPDDRSRWLDVGARLGRKAVVNTFALENPLRLVVDVFDTLLGQPSFSIPVGSHGVEKIKVGQFKTGDPYSITRMVFELKEPRMFALAQGADTLNVVFADTAAAAALAVSVPAAAAPVVKTVPIAVAPVKAEVKAETPPVEHVVEVKAVAPVKEEAKIETRAAETKAPVTIVPPPVIKNEAMAEIRAEVRPAETKVPVAVVAPPEPPQKQETRVLEPESTENDIPLLEERQASHTIHNPTEKYSGDLISPRFKDADLRDVILWVGGRVGLSVIIDQEVHGRVTVSFEDVPWDQFLDMIMKNNKLGRVLEGNVLRVAPLNVLADEEKATMALQNAREASGPILTKTYNLSYATSKDVYEIIKNKKSERGEIVIDARTNALIVSDVQEKIDLIDQIIATLDAATPQVTIETRIVEATSSFVRNLGVQWGFKAVADPYYGNQTSLQFPNKIDVDGALIPEGTTTKGIGGPLGGYAVNLPASSFSTAVGFSLANVLDTFRVDMAITALETEGTGKIISSQRVTAQNNKEAYINQGRQIPVQTTANFTVSTQYVNAGLELRVTPQITADGTIIMTLDIQNNAADFSNLVNGIPPITTQSAKTTVMVPDGGTTVIGGIYRVEDSVTKERVPFLHQIPILGNLFKNLAKNRTNRELLIFITPRIQK